MKQSRVAVFVSVAALLAGLSGLGVYALASRALNRSNHVSCDKSPSEHFVTITHNELSDPEIQGQLCDKLTITNNDDQLRLMAFGVHDHHQAYDGITDKTLLKGQSMTIVLDQHGTFTFHDHLHDEVTGTFTVQ
jgi:hypothetical protein